MKRTIALFICMLLMFSLSGVAQHIVTKTSNETYTTMLDDDVPVWDEDDYWIFDIDTFFIQINESGQFIELDFNMDNLLIEVAQASPGSSYLLDISGKLAGSYSYDDGAGMKIGGALYLTRLSGTMQVRETDLALERGDIKITSIALLTEHPLPISIPIPIPLTIKLSVEHNLPRPLIDFPLFDGKQGIIDEAALSANIRVESIVLKILNIFNPEIPAEIILDQDVNMPNLVYEAIAEEIAVQAGIFNAYNIEFFQGLLGSIYYAPDAGNIIKAEAELDLEGIFVQFHGEVKEYKFD